VEESTSPWLAPSLHLLNKPSELWQWLCDDDSAISPGGLASGWPGAIFTAAFVCLSVDRITKKLRVVFKK